jgi:hypothetical protein
MVRTSRKNARSKNYEQSVLRVSQTRESVGKPRKRWLDDSDNGLKEMGVRGSRKTARDTDAWKWNLKWGKGLACTAQPVESVVRAKYFNFWSFGK